MREKKTLADIFADDPFNLLDVKKINPQAITADERLLESFNEINVFYGQNHREPQSGKGIQEHRLAARLKNLREDPEKASSLAGADEYRLLEVKTKKVESITDIFSDDGFGLLDNDADDIFNLKHVTTPEERAKADLVAHRKKCLNFQDYEALFKNCHQELKDKKRKIIPFVEKSLDKGVFFVLSGIIGYVESILETYKDEFGKIDGRTRIIFENGTESNMLFRSLIKRLYEDGKLITEHQDNYLNPLHSITDEDQESGFIYILKSKSDRQEITSISHLYKIGYSKGAVEERVKNAAQDPTYLMAPVAIVTAFKCYNMNPQKLEQLLHNFFGSSCLNVDVIDERGKRSVPREWFIAPLNVIEEAIEMIVSGEIVHYRYDSNKQEIRARESFDKTRRALSIRQPYAEQIMRGFKKEEYRGIPTNIRGRVYIYASNTLADIDASLRLGIKNEDLPRGVLIGSVEIVGCEGNKRLGYAWILANPERLPELIKPVKKPQPVWFYPF